MITKFFLLIISICFLADCFFVKSSSAYEFPPYEGLSVKIDGTVSQSYTDNITFSKDDQEGAYLTIFSLGLNIQYQGKRRMAEFTGQMNRQISSSEFTNPSENISLRFINEFSEYDRLSITNNYIHTVIPESFTIFERFIEVETEEGVIDTFEQEFGRIRGRFDSYDNRFNLTYTRDIIKELSISTNYSNRQYWSSEEGITDSQQNNVGLKFNYMRSVATTFSLSYRLETSGFEGGGNITNHSISTGITQYITKRLFIQGSVGVVFTENGIRNTSSIEFQNEIDDKTHASLLFSNDVDIRTDREDTFRNWRITGRLNRSILENLHGSISGFYGQGTFGSTGGKDTFTGANIRFSTVLWEHKSGPRLTGNLGYLFSNLDSTEENRGHTRNTVNIGATLGI